MKKLLKFLENHFVRPLEKLSQQRHLAAVRDGILSAFPISLVGTVFLFLASVPLPESWPIKQFLTSHETLLLAPYRVTTLIVTLYIVVGVGSNLAQSYKYSQTSGSLIALVTFFMTVTPANPSSSVPAAFLDSAAKAGIDTTWLSGLRALGWMIPISNLGAAGAFLGALCALMGVEVIHLCKHLYSKIKRPKKVFHIVEVPDSLIEAIQNILPLAIVVVGLFIVRDILGINLQKIIAAFFTSLIRAANNLPGAMLFVLIISMVYFLGVNGLNVSGATSGIWLGLLSANEAARQAGQSLPNVAPLPFFQWFVWMGGTGGTLSLVILLCFSKSGYLKKMGRTCLLPSLVNINDPVLYGTPVILNPYLAIPFLVGPLVTTIFSYIVTYLGLIGKVYTQPMENLPSPIGAFLATGDWRAILLCLINIGICGAIYYPFLKMYEKKLIGEGEKRTEGQAIKDKEPPHVTSVE